MNIIYAVSAFIYGLCAGSFCNVLIYRIPRSITFVRGASLCPACKRRIMPYDLIPLISYIVLRGRCRHCAEPIPLRYPAVELAGGILALLALYWQGLSFLALLYFVFFMLLLVIAHVDAEFMIIPNKLVIVLAVTAAVIAVISRDVPWLYRAIGFFLLSLPMLTLNFFIKDAFGGGDIKFIAVCGFLLGIGPTCAAGFIAVVTAGVKALSIMLSGKPYKNVHMPFGPYLCFGVFAACLFGSQIVAFYLGL